MKRIENISLQDSEGILATANTPLFLLRRLRSDSSVREIINSGISGDVLLRAIKKALSKKPPTLRDSVRPYVYLTALSFNQDISYLREASKLDSRHYDWFGYIAGVLLETYRTTSTETFNVPNRLVMPTLTPPIKVPTKTSKIRMGG